MKEKCNICKEILEAPVQQLGMFMMEHLLKKHKIKWHYNIDDWDEYFTYVEEK